MEDGNSPLLMDDVDRSAAEPYAFSSTNVQELYLGRNLTGDSPGFDFKLDTPGGRYEPILTKVIISNAVTSIGNYAFSGCTGLTSIDIPNSVTSIGNGSFSGCSGLTSVTIPNSVTSIGKSTFSGCSGLTSIDIPNSVTSIGSSVFRYCTGLTNVVIPNSVRNIGDYAFLWMYRSYEC